MGGTEGSAVTVLRKKSSKRVIFLSDLIKSRFLIDRANLVFHIFFSNILLGAFNLISTRFISHYIGESMCLVIGNWTFFV